MMKTSRQTMASRKLVTEIQLARLRLARAEGQLNLAREQSRLARRRRKEAKQAARRARKQARQAKDAFKHAKLLLAEVETRLAWARRLRARKATRKLRAPKTVADARPGKATRRRVEHRATPAKPGVAARARPKRPTPPRSVKRRTSTARKVAVEKHPIIVPREFEAPKSAPTLPGSPAPLQAGTGVGEEQAGETEAEKRVEPPPGGSDTGTSN